MKRIKIEFHLHPSLLRFRIKSKPLCIPASCASARQSRKISKIIGAIPSNVSCERDIVFEYVSRHENSMGSLNRREQTCRLVNCILPNSFNIHIRWMGFAFLLLRAQNGEEQCSVMLMRHAPSLFHRNEWHWRFIVSSLKCTWRPTGISWIKMTWCREWNVNN